jgi:hypothetical protein
VSAEPEASHVSPHHHMSVCFARFSFGTPLPSTIEFALYRCDFPSEQLDPDRSSTVEHDEPTRIIGVDFFDDHEVVMLYKALGGEGARASGAPRLACSPSRLSYRRAPCSRRVSRA